MKFAIETLKGKVISAESTNWSQVVHNVFTNKTSEFMVFDNLIIRKDEICTITPIN